MHAGTFFADDKFADVIEELSGREWSRAESMSPASTLIWSNYARIRFEQLEEGCIVNHMQGIDVLSNKAKLAQLVGKHGITQLVPPTWSHLSAVSLEEFLFDPALNPTNGEPSYWIVKPAALSCGR